MIRTEGHHRRSDERPSLTRPEAVETQGNHHEFGYAGGPMHEARHAELTLNVVPPPLVSYGLYRREREARENVAVRHDDR